MLEPPPTLYKYRRISASTERLLTHGEIKCSSPSEFNDPFECRPIIHFDSSHPNSKEWIKTQLSLRGISRPAERVRLLTAFKRRFATPQTAEQMGLTRLFESVGIFSLTSKEKDILMWAHYAMEYRGVCIGFDTNSWPFRLAWKVEYSDDYPVIKRATDSEDASFKKALLTKTTCWEYEQEWRILMRTLDQNETATLERGRGPIEEWQLREHGPGIYTIPKDSITTLIFGLRTSAEDKNKVREWIHVGGISPTLYQARQDAKNFKIDLEKC